MQSFRTSFLLLSVVGILSAVGISPALAQTRGAFVNRDRLIKEAVMAKTAQEKIKGEFSKREKELLDADAAFRSAVEKFQKEVASLPPAQREARQRILAEQEQGVVEKQRQFQEDLVIRKNEELQKLYELADKAIQQIAQNEKIDFVLLDAAYINPSIDITDKVIKALNGR